ncbi:alpha-L-rhamnosidase [Curtobacterium oceanosedimentum]|uniref:alpha-L-rhamnosidase n=1 Tax=Curtobacterium oceanosedimentum TaxID=465820 RepID=A0ABR5S8E6_9MICO|nr:alpha-L-rhamnosidase [Curtobacterium oceanosedimentum]KTR40735.1 alpha-L-rhamnosidase [Curtobacterium oceanosedimentum]
MSDTTWTAAFITPAEELHSAPVLRKEIRLDREHGALVAARLRVTAVGIVEPWLAGQPVSEDLLVPGWTSYEWRLRSVEYDVTDRLQQLPGDEPVVFGLHIGAGWALGRLTWSGAASFYGSARAGSADLELRYADGTIEVVQTDETWTAAPTGTTADDLYDGQDIDARVGTAWARPGTVDGEVGTRSVPLDAGLVEPSRAPAVRRLSEIEPVAAWTAPSGATLVDFGINIVGWVRVRVTGTEGDRLRLRHAEVLEHEELGVRPLRSAEATDEYVLSGGEDVFEPRFTFHGFRFVEVTGWDRTLEELRGALTAVQIGSDLRRTGHFRSSNDLLNTFHDNVVRGMQGNFVSVPSDCPQRDERLGWTGDIAAFAPTASFLFDTDAFLSDWLRDVWLEQQHQDGVVPFVVPDVLKFLPPLDGIGPQNTTAIWSDAAVWVPWALHRAYGDTAVLAEQFDSMAAHLRRVASLLSPEGLWDTVFQFADWLDPDAPPEDPAAAKADTGVVATACAHRSAVLVADAAELLGRSAEATEFREMATRLRTAFRTHYVSRGQITSDCTTVYALAIVFDLLVDDDVDRAGNRLAELVAESGYRISTGFAGTPFITDALTMTGHVDDAYRLLLQTECPSWLYPVTMGATTVWERWDSMLPDGTINPGEMTSFNHYALGAVADWMHRTVAGLAPLTPGYEQVLIAPLPGGGLTWAEASLESPHGRIAVRWDLDTDELCIRAEVPEDVTAIVRTPDGTERQVGGGEHLIRTPIPTPVL